MEGINFFLYNRNMDNNRKKELRDFIGVNTIAQAKRLLKLPNYTANRLYRLLDNLYTTQQQSSRQTKTNAVKIIQARARARIKARQVRQDIAIRRAGTIIRNAENRELDYKNGLRRHKGQRVKVYTIDDGRIIHTAELLVPNEGFNNWWSREGRRNFLIGDSPPELPTDGYENAKIVITPELGLTNNRINQVFREGVRHCVFQPIKDFATEKLLSAKSRTTQFRYKKIIQNCGELEKLYEKGVPENSVQEIANQLQVNINIDLPCAKEHFITAKSIKSPLHTFQFVNTRLNHIDLNEVICKSNYEELDHKQLQELGKQLIESGEYFDYKKNKDQDFIKIRTLKGQYSSKCEYLELFETFEKDYGLNNIKIDYLNDSVGAFISNGVHHNQSRVFSYDKQEKHIDMKYAYANFKLCSHYKGFLGKITDFRKCNKIVEVGYYLVESFDFSKCNEKVRRLIDMLNYLFGGNVYPSVELDMWKDLGVDFKITEGCWGSKIDFDFPNYMYDKFDNVRHYSRWTGIQEKTNFSQSFYMRGTKEYFENMKPILEGVAEVKCYEDGEGIIEYPRQTSFSLKHIVGFITAYQRLGVINQLLEMDLDKVISVCVDGIYYKDHDFIIKNPFRTKEEIHPVKGQLSYCNTIHNIPDELEYEDDTYIGSYTDAEERPFALVELFEGAGGNGKTHYNLKDKGLVRPMYVAPSYKLSTKKKKDYGCRTEVIANLLHPKKAPDYKKYNNCFIFDECSMINEETKQEILHLYKGCKIIFCGDIGFQLPPTTGIVMNEEGIDRKVKFEKNYRFTCEKHIKIVNEVRDMIEERCDKDDINNFIKNHYQQISSIDNYKPEDIILASKTRCKVHQKEDCNCDGNNFCYEWTSKFEKNKWKCEERTLNNCRGDIVIGEKPKEGKWEWRHGYTIHSVQGEDFNETIYIDGRRLFDFRMGYTAISRAKRWEQIKIIV